MQKYAGERDLAEKQQVQDRNQIGCSKNAKEMRRTVDNSKHQAVNSGTISKI